MTALLAFPLARGIRTKLEGIVEWPNLQSRVAGSIEILCFIIKDDATPECCRQELIGHPGIKVISVAVGVSFGEGPEAMTFHDAAAYRQDICLHRSDVVNTKKVYCLLWARTACTQYSDRWQC